MVNYQSPVTILEDYTAVVKLYHVMNGIYIWEFVTTLGFEWDFIQGRRPYRWTIWVYSVARLAMLSAVINSFVAFDNTSPINCQAWISTGLLSGYISFAASSLLILLRVIAIWNRDKIIIAIGTSIWLTDVGFQINGVARVRASWSPEAKQCAVLNLETTTPTVLATLITDVALLLIMLVGLLRIRLDAGGAFALGRILWKQGLIWLFVATSAEVPSTVLMFLDLNVPLTIILQTPSNILVAIAATGMYRLLVIFGSEFPEAPLETFRGSGRAAASEMRVRSEPIPLSQMEVSVPTECEQDPTSQISNTGFFNTDHNGHCKTHKVTIDVNVESGTGTEKK